MGSAADETFSARPFSRVLVDGPPWLRQWTPLLLVLLGAVIVRHVVTANADVSWLITVAEKVLDGERLYVDVWETNPPASIFFYVLPVAVARIVGWRPELVVDLFVLAAAGASIRLAGRILARARLLDGIDGAKLASLVAVILTIIPAQTFGEREHIVTIAVLPALAVLAVRASGLSPDMPSIIIAGIGAGIAMVAKPHFALAVGPAIMAVAISTRSWRALLVPEGWIAGAMVMLYATAVVLAYPHYITDLVPVARDTYVAVRLSWWTLLGRIPAALLWTATLGLLMVVKPNAVLTPAFRPLLAASVGFGAAFLLQGKGWAYHAFPMLALALTALAVAWCEPDTASPSTPSAAPRIKRLISALLAGVIAGSTFHWMAFSVDLTDLAVPIRRIKANPTMLAISSDTSVGHPLVRQVGGTWVGRAGALWITAGVLNRRLREQLDAETAARLARHAARDRTMLIEDIRRERPDIILVDMAPFDWLAWANRDPKLAELLKSYHAGETMHDILVLRRAT